MIRPATPADADAIAELYNHYIRHTVITFEEDPIDGAEIARRMADVAQTGWPWLVACDAAHGAEQGGAIVGWAYATKFRPRASFRHSVEASVYLAAGASGHGWGTRLYQTLLPLLREGGARAVIGGITLPNATSVALHEKFGFEKVAHFKDVGRKFDQWIDVGYWELILI